MTTNPPQTMPSLPDPLAIWIKGGITPLDTLTDALGMVWFLRTYCDDTPMGKMHREQAEAFVKKYLGDVEKIRWSHEVVDVDRCQSPSPTISEEKIDGCTGREWMQMCGEAEMKLDVAVADTERLASKVKEQADKIMALEAAGLGGETAIPAHILTMAERLRTQDNRCTAHAMFCVQRLVRIDGIDESLGMPMEYRYADDGNALPLEFNEAIEEAMASGASKVEIGDEIYQLDKIEGYGFVDRWETVMVSMTEQGCVDYIKANGHNLEKHGQAPRIYVESFHRCAEMIALREWLMTLPKGPTP